MHHLPNFSYRSLELVCRSQATLSAAAATRRELERMALEYKRLADWLDQQGLEEGLASETASSTARAGEEIEREPHSSGHSRSNPEAYPPPLDAQSAGDPTMRSAREIREIIHRSRELAARSAKILEHNPKPDTFVGRKVARAFPDTSE